MKKKIGRENNSFDDAALIRQNIFFILFIFFVCVFALKTFLCVYLAFKRGNRRWMIEFVYRKNFSIFSWISSF